MENFFVIFGASYLYLIICAIAAVYFFTLSQQIKRSLVILSFFTFLLSFVIEKILSHVIYNPRPFVIDHVRPLIHHVADNGFPSDHTLLTMTVALVFFTYNKKLGAALAVFSLLVGISRVVARVHHMSDIVGSIVIAISAVYVSKYVVKVILPKIKSSKYYNR